jgi:hypothetical protein
MGRGSRVILYLIYFVIVATLGGFIWHSAHTKSPASSKSASTSQHQQAAKNTKPKTSTPPNTGTAGAAMAKAGSSSSAPSSTSTNNQEPLVNTGPGNLLALFIVSSLVAAAIHRRRLISRS